MAEPSTRPGASGKFTRGKLGEKVGSGYLFSHRKDLGFLKRSDYIMFLIICV